MKIVFGINFDRDLSRTRPNIQKKFWKQASFLEKDIRHPSLHAKKYDEINNIWQARIDDNWRFYFIILSDSYVIIKITKHPK